MRRRPSLRRLRHVWPIKLAPWVYAVAASVGVAAGIALDAAMRWPWWTVALGVVVVVWLAFMIPAVARWRWRGPAGLGVTLLEAVAPGRAWRREANLVGRVFRNPPFPLYGLPPSWVGPRSTGGWGATMGHVNRMSLVHGAGGTEATLVVETWNALREEALPLVRGMAAEEVVEPAGASDRTPQPAWEPLAIRVDGEELPFELVHRGDSWAAVGRVPTGVVLVQGHRFPVEDVELERIVDTSRYVEGRPPMAPA